MALFRKRRQQPQDDDELTRELDVVEAVLARYPAGTRISFGAPTRCPDCGDFGLVESVDHAHGVACNHCRTCRRDWIITLRALRARRNGPRGGLGPDQAPPAGALFADSELAPGDAPIVDEPARERLPVDQHLTEVEPEASPPAPDEPRVLLDGSAGTTHVLLIEGNPFEVAALQGLIDGAPDLDPTVVQAATLREGQRAAARHTFDVVVLDLDLPDTTGLDTLRAWRQARGLDIALIALVESADPALIEGARSLGSVHVIQKSHLEQAAAQGRRGSELFGRLIRGAIEIRRTTDDRTVAALAATIDETVDELSAN